MGTIFYSWQRDLPNKTNRGLIEKALDQAVKRLRGDPEIQAAAREDLRVDRDTRGVPGSPDIAATILRKIDEADACVFDVSIAIRAPDPGLLSAFVNWLRRRPPPRRQRPSPNPNVLVELGYALKSKGEDKVIMVFNTAFGNVEELPFDLRMKRALCYSARESDEAADSRGQLVSQLQSALQEVYLRSEDHRFSPEEHRFYLSVFNAARSFLDDAEELQARQLSPFLDQFEASCEQIAGHLRELSADDVADSTPDLRTKMATAADALDGIARWEHVLGDGAKFREAVLATAEKIEPLIEPCVPALRIRFAEDDHEGTKRRLARRAVSEFERFAELLEQKEGRRLSDMRGELSRIGQELLRLAAELEVVGDGDASRLRASGHALRVAEIRGTDVIGFRPETELRDRLRPVIDDLRPLAELADAASPTQAGRTTT